jgi:hypothetical protein
MQKEIKMIILKYLFLLLGLFEIISNFIHLSKKSIDKIGSSAKKQHQELSLKLPNIHFYYKVIIMFTFGFLFLFTSILNFLNIGFFPIVVWITTISFGLYGIIQALIYRTEIKVWPAMLVYNIPLIMNVLLK